MLPGKRPFVAPSAVIQGRQLLGEAPVREVFQQTQVILSNALPTSNWCGLKLLGVDGVVWRTLNTQNNLAEFARTRNEVKESNYPKVRMACQMELSSHVVINSSFSRASKMKGF